MDGGGAEAVGGEDGTDGVAAGKYYQGEVGAVGLFDACAGGEELDAVDVQQLVCGFFCKVDCYFAVSLFGVVVDLVFKRPFGSSGSSEKCYCTCPFSVTHVCPVQRIWSAKVTSSASMVLMPPDPS